MCANNTVVILMRTCDRGKSETRGTRSVEGAPCEGCLVVRVRSTALTHRPLVVGMIDAIPNYPVCRTLSRHNRGKERDEQAVDKGEAQHSVGQECGC